MAAAHDSDPDRTVIRGAGESRFGATSSIWPHTLPEGTRIGDFEIVGLVGEGGFGIVYLAWDTTLERHVALKEYMPQTLAARLRDGLDVSVKSERQRETFDAGLRSFVNEARLLARFDHPALVKVYRFWESNGTAYMVMPYYEGPTLKQALTAAPTPPDEATLRAWLRPLLDALTLMHAARCWHRDIAPDNILLTGNGPLLLDFGAARRVIGDMTQALTVVLKPGFAPIEQYGDGIAGNQGPWTDLYALAGVVHYAITGRAPVPSVDRILADRLVPLAQQARGRYSERFLQAIDACLALKPEDRPASVEALRERLGDASPPPVAAVAVPVPAPVPAPAPAPVAPAPAARPVAAAPAVVVARVPDLEPTIVDLLPPVVAPKRGVPAVAWAGGAVVLAGALAATWFALRPAPTVEVAPPTVDAAAPAASQAVATPAPVLPPVATPEPAPTVVAEPAVSAPAVVASAPEPIPAVRVEAPVAREMRPAAAPVKTPKPPPAATARTPDAEAARPEPAPKPAGRLSARCSDILQKASLEPLTAEETEILRSECR